MKTPPAYSTPVSPWAGWSILATDTDTLSTWRQAAAGEDLLRIVDMPEVAQTSRIYDEYLDQLADRKQEDLACSATSLIGPRSKIDKLVHKLSLLR